MKATNKLYNGVHGSSTINHRIRCKLGLSINQYVALDFVMNIKEGLSLDAECWKQIGMTPEEFGYCYDTMLQQQPNIVQQWLDIFNTDADFDEFWNHIFMKHGNKADAQKKYQECRKLVEKTVLHSRAVLYIQSRTDFPNYTKAAEVWLNPKKRHWEDVLPGDRKQEEKPFNPIFPKD